jgi:holo-[acyl-carrier protein] synthase
MPRVGIDIIEIGRIEKAVARWGDVFLRRVYTDNECELYHSKSSSLAARFAGKEAAIKALSIPGRTIGWKDVEILSASDGKPALHLHGEARNQASLLGIEELSVSLSHCREYAVAMVAAETIKNV